MKISPKSMVDGLLPTPSCKRITLQGGGGVDIQSAYRLAPHVASTANESWSYNDISETLPGFGQRDLSITLDVVVRDVFGVPNFSQWAGNNFSKYIKVVVLQAPSWGAKEVISTTKKLGRKELLGGINALQQLNWVSQSDFKTFQLGEVAKASNLVDSEASYKDFVERNMIIDSDGNKVYEIPFSVTFNGLPEAPTDISYLMFSYVDFNALKEDYPEIDVSELGPDSVELQGGNVADSPIIFPDLMGDVMFENVFVNGALKTNAQAYRLSDGSYWGGAVHFMDNGSAMTGFMHDASSVILSSTKVSNAKIQDFRVRNIPFIPSSFNLGVGELFQSITTPSKKAGDSFIVPDKVAYFSDVHLAQGHDKSIRGIFFMDVERILLEESMFPVAVMNSKRVDVLKNSPIVSFNLIRREVFEDNATLDYKNPLFQSREETVVSTKDPLAGGTSKKIKPVIASAGVSFEELDVSLINHNTQLAVRSFGFRDRTVKSGAKYQYGIEFTLIDGTLGVLKAELTKLRALRAQLIQNHAILDVKTNLVKGTRYLSDEARLANSTRINQSAQGLAYTLPGVFEFFRGNNDDYSLDKQAALIKKLVFLLNDMDGFLEVIRTVSRVETTLEKAAASTTASSKGAAQVSDVASVTPQRRLIFKHFFEDTFGTKEYYVDVLAEQKMTSGAEPYKKQVIRELSHVTYINRADLEYLKFFVGTDPMKFRDTIVDGQVDKTKLSYLTPTVLTNRVFGTEEAIMEGNISNSDAKFKEMLFDLIKTVDNKGVHNVKDQSSQFASDPESQDNIDSENSAMAIAATDFSATPLAAPLFGVAPMGMMPPSMEIDTTANVENIWDPDSETMAVHTSIQDRKQSQALFGNQSVGTVDFYTYLTFGDSVIKYIPLDLSYNFAEAFSPVKGNYKGYEKISPVQIKNLYALSLPASQAKDPCKLDGPVTSEQLRNYKLTPKTFFLYQNIFEVEYLLGFGVSEDGYRMMKKPLFNKLVGGNFATLPHTLLMCRMRLYEGAASIPPPVKLRLRPLEETFLISKPGISAPLPPVSSPWVPEPLTEGDAVANTQSRSDDETGGGVGGMPSKGKGKDPTPPRTPPSTPTDFSGGGYGSI